MVFSWDFRFWNFIFFPKMIQKSEAWPSFMTWIEFEIEKWLYLQPALKEFWEESRETRDI